MGKLGPRFRSVPLAIYLCALFVFIASILGSTFIFHRSPHINDEFGYIFQARLFASGHLYAPSPCFREAFDFPHIINNGKWYSQYPPGFPLLLVPWVMAGVPWLINPLFAGSSIFVLYFLGLELFGKKEGLLAAMLGAASIWLIVMSSTLMSHTTNMFFFALFMLFLFRSLRSPSLLNGVLAGSSLGLAVLIRPYETILAAVPFLVLYGVKFMKEFRARLKDAAGFAAAGLVFAGMFLAYNYLTNGDPFLLGHIVRYGPEHGIGFGRTGYTSIPHTPAKGLMQIAENYKAINDFLFGWPLSSLFFFIPIVVWLRKIRERTAVLLLLASFLTVSAGLFIYWGTFVILGARMFFLLFPALVLLSAKGISLTLDNLPSRMRIGRFLPKGELLAAGILIVFTLYAFLVKLPGECGSNSTGDLIDIQPSSAPEKFSKTWGNAPMPQTLVVTRFLRSQLKEFPAGGWGLALILNDPLLESSTIYARDMGPQNTKFFRCYPDRKIYLYWGTLEKGYFVPMELDNGRIVFGRPVLDLDGGGKRKAGLAAAPEDVFRLYSRPFKDFLSRFFLENDFSGLDAAGLEERAVDAIGANDLQAGAYLLEAALQAEAETNSRYRMLGRLAALYRRLGDKAGSDIIQKRLNSRKDFDVYNVIPEKGF